MSDRIRKAALWLALLREEFSAAELTAATALLDRVSDPLRVGGEVPKPRATSSALRGMSGTKRPSKLLEGIREVDPKKYETLIQLEAVLKSGSVLPTVREIGSIGMRFDKTFTPGKSRRDAVSRLLRLLITRDTAELAAFAEQLETGTQERDAPDGYLKLARFIIGTTTHSDPSAEE